MARRDPLHARYEPPGIPHSSVWENPHLLPRAFVVFRATVLPDDRRPGACAAHARPAHRRRRRRRAGASPPQGTAHATPPATLVRWPSARRVDHRHRFAGRRTSRPVGRPLSRLVRAPSTEHRRAPARRLCAFVASPLPAGRHAVEIRLPFSRPTADRSCRCRPLGLLGSPVGFAAIGDGARCRRHSGATF